MKLTAFDIGSTLWQKLEDHYRPILAKSRARAENIELDQNERMKLLHQIAHIKALLEMAEPAKKVMSAAE